MASKDQLKVKFSTGKKPTGADFASFIESVAEQASMDELSEKVTVATDKASIANQATEQALVGVDNTIYTTLKERLDSENKSLTTELADKANESEVRLKSVKNELEDMSPTVLAAIEGGAETSFNLLSIPQDASVTPEKTDFMKADAQNILNPYNMVDGYRLGPTGELFADAIWSTSLDTKVTNGKSYKVIVGSNPGNVSGRIIAYDMNKIFLKVISSGLTSGSNIDIDFDGYVGLPVKTVDKHSSQIADTLIYNGTFSPFGYFLDGYVKATTLGSSIVNASNLKDDFRYAGTHTAPNLNTFLKDGTYFLISGSTNRPSEVSDSNGYLVVTSLGNTIIQDYMQYTTGKQNMVYRRFIRTNISEFGEWFLLTNDQEHGINVFNKKKTVNMGDSITGGTSYGLQISKRLRSTAINCGFGGTRMTFHTDPDFDKFSFVKLVDAKISGDFTEQDDAATRLNVTNMAANLENLKNTDFSTVDYLTIWFGTNDFSGDIHIGENNSEDKTTVKGALQYGIRRLLEAYPQLKIIVITPMFRTVGIAGGTSDDTTNTYRLLYLKDYTKAIKEVAELNHTPCLDMFNESGINKFNHTYYFSDGLHPYLENGWRHIGNKIASFISSNF